MLTGTSEADDTVACILQPLIHAAGAMRHLSGNAMHNARMGREVRLFSTMASKPMAPPSSI
jgi:hypothetical protein